MARLLLVEDDDRIGRVLHPALVANGHEATWMRTGAGALAAATEVGFDLVLLDLGLPDADGLEICRELRLRLPRCLLVLLTARSQEMDIVIGLESGADDYVTKPFGMTALLARIRAHLRRADSLEPTPGVPCYVAGDLRVDLRSRRCFLAGAELVLRPKEYDLLARLAQQPGQAVSREALMADVWDAQWFGSTKTLDVHMAALRRALARAADAGGRPPAITTLRGFGYRLEVDDAAASR